MAEKQLEALSNRRPKVKMRELKCYLEFKEQCVSRGARTVGLNSIFGLLIGLILLLLAIFLLYSHRDNLKINLELSLFVPPNDSIGSDPHGGLCGWWTQLLVPHCKDMWWVTWPPGTGNNPPPGLAAGGCSGITRPCRVTPRLFSILMNGF